MDPGFHIILIYKNLKNRIKKNEGFSRKPYKDQLGFLTIGYGHLILSNEKFLLKEKTDKQKLEKVFLDDFNKALKEFHKHFKHLTSNKKDSELLIEMNFQMGAERVRKFTKLLYNMRRGHKHLVCFEMMSSFWYKQTPNRVKSLIMVFLNK